MGWLGRTLGTTIGAKWLMGLTGIGLFLFVVGHMIGNLQVFLPPEALNEYAVKLRSFGPLLWIIRGSLLLIFVAHVWAAFRLTRLNRAARPVRYRVRRTIANTSSRTMMWGGIALLAFIIYHLLHFTFHYTHPEFAELTDSAGRFDVHTMVVQGFRDPLVVGIYVVGIFALLLHLMHGISSFFQTIGANHPNWMRLWNATGPVLGVIVFFGNIAMPLAVYTEVVKFAAEVQ